jgi:putative nucleotidyltransferase with HDIG domain
VQLKVCVPGARLCEPQHVRTGTRFDCSEFLARAKLLRVTDPRSAHNNNPQFDHMTRDAAWALLNEFTKSESLIKHALAVETAMRHYASRLAEDPETWGITGLIHDFDYERWPNPPEHTREGALILRERGVDEEIIGAILSHAEWNHADYPLDRPIRKALFAVDELCGFITAVAYVRPEKLTGMAASSVRKKMQQKSFAAAVKREDIEKGATLLNLPLDDHINNVIAGMQTAAGPLGFA